MQSQATSLGFRDYPVRMRASPFYSEIGISLHAPDCQQPVEWTDRWRQLSQLPRDTAQRGGERGRGRNHTGIAPLLRSSGYNTITWMAPHGQDSFTLAVEGEMCSGAVVDLRGCINLSCTVDKPTQNTAPWTETTLTQLCVGYHQY